VSKRAKDSVAGILISANKLSLVSLMVVDFKSPREPWG
jgi:hypothetical protein